MCDHSVVMAGMCAICGEDLRAKEKSSTQPDVVQPDRSKALKRGFSSSAASVAVVHNIPELVVSESLANEMGKDEIQKLLTKRQLVLLVDLDQTLVHTTNEVVPPNMKDVHAFNLANGRYNVCYNTKLRPGTQNFLKEISTKFELQIATFGSRMYAHQIAEFLDPEKKFFHASRILSRDECFSPITKTANMASLFPCGDSLVCIIDDRDEVWNYAKNLIRVRPYFYFAYTGDINAPPGSKESKEMAEIGGDIKKRRTTEDTETETKEHEDTDDYLFYLPDILNDIHRTFYKKYDEYMADPQKNQLPDVKEIIPVLKSKTLAGCRIVFSGVIPKNVPVGLSRPHMVAKEFGAIIQNEVVRDPEENRTTHVIAAYWNTTKVKAAQELQCHIVTIGWLWCCSERWSKVDERLFFLPEEAGSNAAAVRSSERGDPKSKLKSSRKDPSAEPSTSSAIEEVEKKPIVLSASEIAEMNNEVLKALEEDGLSLDSISSDDEEDENADFTKIGEKNPRMKKESISSSDEEILDTVQGSDSSSEDL